MARVSKNKVTSLTRTEDIRLEKIQILFKRSFLKSVFNILIMKQSDFRTFKSVKNINRLFSSLHEDLYKNQEELKAYIWCIAYFSKQWLEGITTIDLIVEGAKQHPEYDNIKDEIIRTNLASDYIITEAESRLIFDIITNAIQFGYLISIKNEYQNLLDDISFDDPAAFRKVADRLFEISNSLMNIKHSTSVISNKITFNTDDEETVKDALTRTITSLSESNAFYKTGIRRLNSLLSPGFMNARLYVFIGLPSSYKSGMLLKAALDIRKYNLGVKTKSEGMKPCVLYITMENSFIETIERIWNMNFDDSMVDYTIEEAVERLTYELGITQIIGDDEINMIKPDIINIEDSTTKPNIEIVIKYFSYREINTDDLYTIIQDLRDDNLEVIALSLDYIKRIRPNVPIEDNVRLELDRVCNELKALSVLLNIPVITAHQMNRVAASTVDAAARQGRGDVTKLVGREHVGDSWSVIEVADWACILNIEFDRDNKRYLVMNVIKRRRIDNSSGELSKYLYIAHPFSIQNGFRLLDDMHLDRVLSLQSLVTDIDPLAPNETVNAVPRPNSPLSVFSRIENGDDDNEDDDISESSDILL